MTVAVVLPLRPVRFYSGPQADDDSGDASDGAPMTTSWSMP